MARNRINLVRAGSIAAVLLFALAFWLGFPVPPRAATTADIQTPGTNEPFLAGDERSIPILQDMLGTLKQIDGRLERIEKRMAAQKQQPQQPEQ